MSLKTIFKNKIIWIIVFSVVGFGLSYNLYHYIELKQNSGYTVGKVIESRISGKGGRSWRTTYTYTVKGISYLGKQREKSLKENDLCVVVYNKKSPEVSMIADYYKDIESLNGDKVEIDTNYVEISIWNFTPLW